MDRADIVIVGGGLAAAVTAEQFRKSGGTGTVMMISGEPEPPVHRPPLSKEYLRGDTDRDSVFVHPPAFYEENGIAVRLGQHVERIDLAGKGVGLKGGEEVLFDRLVLATGARPRRLETVGADLAGILYLRSLADAERLRAAYERAGRALIIGAGFIGMEVAATLAQRGVEATVIEMGPRMWPSLAPQPVADFIQGYYEARGVRFRFGQPVAGFLGHDEVRAVLLESGEALPADLVVVGAGVILNTGLAEEAGLDVYRGIVVDEYLRTGHPDVYAVGDVASFPDPIEGRTHLEHWDNAVQQGRTLGATLAGEPTAFDHVAYFFSDLFDLSLNMVGYPLRWDNAVVRGDPASGRFTTVYGREGTVRAALMINDDEYFDAWTALVKRRAPLNAEMLADPTVDPAGLVSVGV